MQRHRHDTLETGHFHLLTWTFRHKRHARAFRRVSDAATAALQTHASCSARRRLRSASMRWAWVPAASSLSAPPKASKRSMPH